MGVMLEGYVWLLVIPALLTCSPLGQHPRVKEEAPVVDARRSLLLLQAMTNDALGNTADAGGKQHVDSYMRKYLTSEGQGQHMADLSRARRAAHGNPEHLLHASPEVDLAHKVDHNSTEQGLNHSAELMPDHHPASPEVHTPVIGPDEHAPAPGPDEHAPDPGPDEHGPHPPLGHSKEAPEGPLHPPEPEPDHTEPAASHSDVIEHLLAHILHQVRAGHVTMDNMTKWMTKIRAAMEDGSLSQPRYDQFMEDLMAIRHSAEAHGHESDDNSLWFG